MVATSFRDCSHGMRIALSLDVPLPPTLVCYPPSPLLPGSVLFISTADGSLMASSSSTAGAESCQARSSIDPLIAASATYLEER